MNSSRVFFGTAINEHKLYCFGGNYWDGTSVVYFDLYNEVWIEVERMPEIFASFSAVTVHDV